MPTNTVRRILDKTNQFSIMNTDIDETTLQRKGVSLWLYVPCAPTTLAYLRAAYVG